MALVRVNADDKGVSLSSVLPGDPVEVSADKRALKQIALNLLSNAVKFTPRDGAITVTVEAIGPYLEVIVADTGVGIAPEDVRRLGRQSVTVALHGFDDRFNGLFPEFLGAFVWPLGQ